jgi:hypothetical protein
MACSYKTKGQLVFNIRGDTWFGGLESSWILVPNEEFEPITGFLLVPSIYVGTRIRINIFEKLKKINQELMKV